MKSQSLVCAAALALALAISSGCASINSVSLTPIPAQRSHPVRAEVEKTIFLAFNFDNDFVDPLIDDLKNQCPNGIVSGILTKDETTSYVIVFKRKVIATGYCSVGRSASAPTQRQQQRRRPSAEEPPADEAAL